jgi:hypothetical protein
VGFLTLISCLLWIGVKTPPTDTSFGIPKLILKQRTTFKTKNFQGRILL